MSDNQPELTNRSKLQRGSDGLFDKALKLAMFAGSISVVALAFQKMYFTPTSARRIPDVSVPTVPLIVDGLPYRGDLKAPVGLLVYSDFQCPFCGRVARDVLPAFYDEYIRPGKAVLFFRHLPLPNHPYALKAAIGAECAHGQRAFWDMHDWLFSESSHLSEPAIIERATQLGLDVNAFRACLDAESTKRAITRGLEEATQYGIATTPTFFVGALGADKRLKVKRVIMGARPITEFRTIVDSLLKTENAPH